MKKLIVILSPYKSKYYPVQARYNKNGVAYHEVFETAKQARNELSWRFYDGILYKIEYKEKGFTEATP